MQSGPSRSRRRHRSSPPIRRCAMRCSIASVPCEPPGLVSDGRDMGSVVFPDAVLKVFLTATAETRAERRYKQLMGKGLPANLQTILHDLRMRDARDSGRAVAPLQAGAPEAVLDSDDLTIEQVVSIVLERYRIAVRVQASGRSAGAGGSTLQD